MKVRDVMTVKVQTCGADATLQTAARIMWSHDCGAVPVVDEENRVVGMLTDRDVAMTACVQGHALSELHVRAAMSRQIFTCGPDASLEEAERTMREHGVRRLAVVGEDYRLVGILSLDDIAREAVEEENLKFPAVGFRDVGRTLAATVRARPS
ncbi:MAG: CBS domain-containing protein [Deltaproteobacteria bacterium]|nr:CBS domain-containing protein [Deltaproteobacteria bacterium]